MFIRLRHMILFLVLANLHFISWREYRNGYPKTDGGMDKMQEWLDLNSDHIEILHMGSNDSMDEFGFATYVWMLYRENNKHQ